jgi:hypothetical protein
MSRFAVAAAVACALAGSAVAAGPYDDLLKHASAHTNTVVLIDVKEAYASPLAQKEKWAEKARNNGYGGLGFVPPEAERVAITGEINLTTMVRDFQIGFVKVPNLPNFKDLAAREGGTTDTIADKLTVLSPRNVYFTSFGGGTLAAVYPADRQYIARWLKADRADKLPGLVPYLRKAADDASESTIVIALDLEDVVDPAVLRFGLGVSPVMAKHKDANQLALSVFLSRAKGLTLSAKVDEGINGTLVVEFSDDVDRYKSVLKDLFLEVIEAYGVSVAGMEKWEAKFGQKTMTLSGPMAAGDLKRLVSLFAFPHPGMFEEQPPAGDEPNAAATRRYLAGVAAVLNDVKTMRQSSNYAKTATWHDKAASQLEQITRRNVDPAAVDFAYQSAKRLRAISASLRGVPIDVNALAQKGYVYTERIPVWGGWGPHWGGWWGGYRALAFAPTTVQTNVPQVQGEMARVIADDQKRRIEAWTQIDQLLSDTRRKLGEKYKTDF